MLPNAYLWSLSQVEQARLVAQRADKTSPELPAPEVAARKQVNGRVPESHPRAESPDTQNSELKHQEAAKISREPLRP
jgi:hypothetical protein